KKKKATQLAVRASRVNVPLAAHRRPSNSTTPHARTALTGNCPNPHHSKRGIGKYTLTGLPYRCSTRLICGKCAPAKTEQYRMRKRFMLRASAGAKNIRSNARKPSLIIEKVL